MKTSDRLDAVQALLREGSSREARVRLRELCAKPLKQREDTVRLAYLARLAGLAELSLRLLHRVVRGESRKRAAEPEEKAEYGMALAAIGAGREAVALLSEVDTTRLPWAFHGLMLAYFRQWDWAAALPHVRRFLGLAGLSEGDRLNATYYLGRALLHGGSESDGPREARELFERLCAETRRLGYGGLHQDALLALADAHYLTARWPEALSALDRLDAELPGAQSSPMGLSSQQLRFQTQLRVSRGADRAALASLRLVRAQWVELRRWERVRGCDYQEALILGDERLLLRLYFGTPYAPARAKFLRESGFPERRLPEHLDWQLEAGEGGPLLDPLSGLLTASRGDARPTLKPGQLPLRVLRALARDLYVPPTVARLHELIHPGEVIHPAAGPARVRQALKSTREALARARLPLRIDETQGLYQLVARQPFALRLPRPSEEPGSAEAVKVEGWLVRAAETFGARDFSSTELARAEGVSERTARRFLKEALARGLLRCERRPSGEVCYLLEARRP